MPEGRGGVMVVGRDAWLRDGPPRSIGSDDIGELDGEVMITLPNCRDSIYILSSIDQSEILERDMIDDIRRALAITPASTFRERTVDITTVGRRSGRLHRIETHFYRYSDRIYLSGMPGPRDWLANLQANPRMVLHLKHGVRADIPATACVVTGDNERRQAFAYFVAELNQPHNPGLLSEPTSVASWMAGSPLALLDFEDDWLRDLRQIPRA